MPLIGLTLFLLLPLGCRELRLPQLPEPELEIASGLVIDDRDQPVKDSYVELRAGRSNNEGGEIRWSGETGEDGIFRSQIPNWLSARHLRDHRGKYPDSGSVLTREEEKKSKPRLLRLSAQSGVGAASAEARLGARPADGR